MRSFSCSKLFACCLRHDRGRLLVAAIGHRNTNALKTLSPAQPNLTLPPHPTLPLHPNAPDSPHPPSRLCTLNCPPIPSLLESSPCTSPEAFAHANLCRFHPAPSELERFEPIQGVQGILWDGSLDAPNRRPPWPAISKSRDVVAPAHAKRKDETRSKQRVTPYMCRRTTPLALCSRGGKVEYARQHTSKRLRGKQRQCQS